jgi:pyridoxal biosynthesis lyase PdxS
MNQFPTTAMIRTGNQAMTHAINGNFRAANAKQTQLANQILNSNKLTTKNVKQALNHLISVNQEIRNIKNMLTKGKFVMAPKSFQFSAQNF